MTANEMNAWYDWGNGMKLWRELYAQYNLVPFKGGNTGVLCRWVDGSKKRSNPLQISKA